MNNNRTTTQKIGDWGEDTVIEYLQNRGYEFVARNYHSRYGEIDVIVKNEEYLAFVEVKTRNTQSAARPSDFVDSRKQKKLIMTAAVFLSEHEWDLQPRFDVAEVLYHKHTAEIVKVEYIENAFEQSGDYAVF